MQEVELRDYLKIILERKTIIIFTVVIFFVASLVMNAYLIKPDFKTTAKLMLSNNHLEEKERVLKVYAAYDFALEIKKELKLDSLPPMPELEIIEGDILELSLVYHNPKEVIRICNAFLFKFEKEERQKYEKSKSYFQEEIKSAEQEIVGLKEERKKLMENINVTLQELKVKSVEELTVPFSQFVHFQSAKQVDKRIFALESETKSLNGKLNSLHPPFIITPSLGAENMSISKKSGVVLSLFIGLIIGIGVAFIVDYGKVQGFTSEGSV